MSVVASVVTSLETVMSVVASVVASLESVAFFLTVLAAEATAFLAPFAV